MTISHAVVILGGIRLYDVADALTLGLLGAQSFNLYVTPDRKGSFLLMD